MRTLIWIRRDLRTRDNTALHEAARAASRGVIAVFLLSPAQWRKHDDAPVKIDLWLRTLGELSRDLAARNIPLLIRTADRFADAPRVLLDLARAFECDALHYNREYEVNERDRDDAVTRAFEDDGRRVHAHHDHVAIAPDAIETGQGGYYTVFTPYKKSWIRRADERGGFEVLPAPKRQPEMVTHADQVPTSVDGFPVERSMADRWPAGETAGRRRLAAFIRERLHEYKDRRDFPGTNGTSVLSPYLAAGIISPRQCIAAALDANRGRYDSGDAGAVQWISELIWREFYVHILTGFPRVSRHQPFRLETRAIEWSDDEAHFEAWAAGRTGYPLVDAAMRQLVQTGWMHNRLRMVAAMFLTKNLFIDWRRGERFFMQHLVDGDLASNNGGWQWSASTGTDASPYFRIFNPISQSRKFDADGGFIRRFVPELEGVEAERIHEPSRLPSLLRSGLDYSEPIVDHSVTRQRAIEAFRSLKQA